MYARDESACVVRSACDSSDDDAWFGVRGDDDDDDDGGDDDGWWWERGGGVCKTERVDGGEKRETRWNPKQRAADGGVHASESDGERRSGGGTRGQVWSRGDCNAVCINER